MSPKKDLPHQAPPDLGQAAREIPRKPLELDSNSVGSFDVMHRGAPPVSGGQKARDLGGQRARPWGGADLDLGGWARGREDGKVLTERGLKSQRRNWARGAPQTGQERPGGRWRLWENSETRFRGPCSVTLAPRAGAALSRPL